MPKPITSASSRTSALPAGLADKPIVSAVSEVEAAIPRDRWDRPLIIPPGGGKPVAYVRSSTVAEVLEDKFNLNQWQKRMVAGGMAKRADLVLSAAQIEHDDELSVQAKKKELDLITEAAMEANGAGMAARDGTTLHAFTDRLDRGLSLPKGLPPHVNKMLRAYGKATEKMDFIDSEQFVVHDEWGVAGTYDRRVFFEGALRIGDLKTGQHIDYLGLKTCAQVVSYAEGDLYDLDGERTPHGADTDLGILIWLPYTTNPDDVVCEVRWLDLVWGRRAVKEAMRIRKLRAVRPLVLMPRIEGHPPEKG